MSLTIVFASGNQREWHVGKSIPCQYDEVKAVVEIQADGDELEHIKEKFRNPTDRTIYTIPVPRTRVVRWFGDIARTIIGNL